MLEPLWKVLEEAEEIDLQDAILKAKLPPYEARMAVRQVLIDFTVKWKGLQLTLIGREKGIKELANSELFGKIMLLEKCENSNITPEGLDLHLWFEKARYCKTSSINSPMFDVNGPKIRKPLTYSSLLERRMSHGELP